MAAQLAIENPLLSDVKPFEPHAEFAKQLASMLPEFMTVVLEPNEESMISRLTISVQYKTMVKLGIPVPDVNDIKVQFLSTFKAAVNSLDANS